MIPPVSGVLRTHPGWGCQSRLHTMDSSGFSNTPQATNAQCSRSFCKLYPLNTTRNHVKGNGHLDGAALAFISSCLESHSGA